MELNGKQKAAMLLASLDPASAAELLKGVNPETVQDLAVELAYLNSSGLFNSEQSAEVASQFYNSLQGGENFQFDDFLGQMLKSVVGEEQADLIQTQIQNLLQRRDPFIPIRSAEAKVLAKILGNELPQAAAIVLTELPPKKSSDILSLLNEDIRLNVISRMTDSMSASDEAKRRIAEMVCSRLEMLAEDGEAVDTNGPLRKVAVMLRNLGQEIRDGLIESLKEKDPDAGEKVMELMVLWEDISQVADRSLQNILREIDSQKLALAMIKADEEIVKKIKSNISERAAETIEEETSLMSSPKKADIAQAREDIAKVLRESNEKGELDFVEE